MKICFIGLGSIAERHIINLKKLLKDDVQITVLRSGKGRVISDSLRVAVDKVCTNETELEKWYDGVFITNPTFLHYNTLLNHHDRSNTFFIEKPVFMNGFENILPFMDNKKYYVACPLRYSGVIQYLRNNIDFTQIYSIRCISSSFLPNWRPGKDYRKTYSAHSEMGGGVSIDLIHEWDYLAYLIGMPEIVKSIITKKSNLEIKSDDLAVYIAEYKDKVVEIHLDYFGRETQRKIELYGQEDTVVADMVNSRIEYLIEGKIIDLREDRNDCYIKEIKHFVNMINDMESSGNDLEHACKVLRLAKGE